MLVLMILVYSAVSGKESEKFTSLYLFKSDLPSGSIIAAADILEIKVQSDTGLSTEYADAYEITGKYIHSDVRSGQLVLKSDLFDNESSRVYDDIEPGNVLYTLSLKAEDVNGWWIRPGNLVDILIYDETGYNNFSQREDSDVKNPETIENLKIIRLMDENGKDTAKSGKPPVLICLETEYENAGILFEAEITKKIKIITGNKKIEN